MQKGVRIIVIILILAVISIILVDIVVFSPPEIERPTNIMYDSDTNTIKLSSLTLEQKIAQMTITYGRLRNMEALQNLVIGGVYLDKEDSEDKYVLIIDKFQKEAPIPFLVTTDMEGCWNPFTNFRHFPRFKEIETKEEAYEVGVQEGGLMRSLGFTMNFAPVVDLEDKVSKCRSFPGSAEEVAAKGAAYIRGLRSQNILATAKHYPGKTLSNKDTHVYLTSVTIESKDLLPYEKAIENNVSAIMVSHVIADGLIDSEGKPACASEKLIADLRKDFDGLIITDEIRMWGITKYYKDKDEKYIDLFKADNDIILNFAISANELVHMTSVVAQAVRNGTISEERIDRSVTRILTAKGINVE